MEIQTSRQVVCSRCHYLKTDLKYRVKSPSNPCSTHHQCPSEWMQQPHTLTDCPTHHKLGHPEEKEKEKYDKQIREIDRKRKIEEEKMITKKRKMNEKEKKNQQMDDYKQKKKEIEVHTKIGEWDSYRKTKNLSSRAGSLAMGDIMNSARSFMNQQITNIKSSKNDDKFNNNNNTPPPSPRVDVSLSEQKKTRLESNNTNDNKTSETNDEDPIIDLLSAESPSISFHEDDEATLGVEEQIITNSNHKIKSNDNCEITNHNNDKVCEELQNIGITLSVITGIVTQIAHLLSTNNVKHDSTPENDTVTKNDNVPKNDPQPSISQSNDFLI